MASETVNYDNEKSKRYNRHMDIYQENYGDIIEFTVDHSINYKNKAKWVELQKKYSNEDANIEAFVNIFDKNLRYVSFSEYEARIKILCDEIIKKYGDKRLYLYLGETYVKKSNFWVSMIVFNYLMEYIEDVIDNTIKLKGDELYYNDEKIKNHKDIYVLHVDDMSYSGLQMYTSVNQQIIPQWIIMVPYISDIAKNWISKKNVIFLDGTETIKSLGTLLKEYSQEHKIEHKQLYDTTKNLLREYAFLHKDSNMFGKINVSLIYFQHKIADHVSVPRFLIMLGIVYDNKQNKIIPPQKDMCMINNCEDTVNNCISKLENTAESKITPELLNEYFAFERVCGNECPAPIYKEHKYTYLGKNISQSFINRIYNGGKLPYLSIILYIIIIILIIFILFTPISERVSWLYN